MDKLQFLLEAKKETYAAHKKPLLLPGEGRRLIYESKEFIYIDIYYGYSPFGGQELLFKKWQDESFSAIWYMNYGGTILDISNCHTIEAIFSFLRLALSEVDENFPFRGPEVFESEKFIYRSKHSGTTEYFSGEEKIILDGILVYEGHFFGGEIKGRETFNFGV